MRKLLAVSVILVVAISLLIWVGIVEASIPVLRLTRLAADYRGGTVQVDDGKVAEVESRSPLVFTVSPEGDRSLTLRVESDRIAPENLKSGTGVSIRGTYDPGTGVFHAYRVSTQCPSKYEAVRSARQTQESPDVPAAEGRVSEDRVPEGRVPENNSGSALWKS